MMTKDDQYAQIVPSIISQHQAYMTDFNRIERMRSNVDIWSDRVQDNDCNEEDGSNGPNFGPVGAN